MGIVCFCHHFCGRFFLLFFSFFGCLVFLYGKAALFFFLSFFWGGSWVWGGGGNGGWMRDIFEGEENGGVEDVPNQIASYSLIIA